MDFRCPKHDLIFETVTDHRKPGALKNDKFPAHPVNGHPDCPKCHEEAQDKTANSSSASGTTEGVRVSNRRR
jgi:hypothetical protein